VVDGDSAAFVDGLRGAQVQGVWRRAKWIVIDVDDRGGRRRQVLVHLKMTGDLHVREAADVPRFLRFSWKLDDGRRLCFTDPRRFGHVELLPAAFSDTMGHAGALVRHPDGRIEGASDPRSDGAARGLVPDRSQPRRIGMAGVVEGGGVLGHQHQGVCAHACDDRLTMGAEEELHVDPGVAEETIGGDRPGAVGAAPGEAARLSVAPKILRQLIQALFETGIPDLETAELFLSPMTGRVGAFGG
jgi:hypothetical protein